MSNLTARILVTLALLCSACSAKWVDTPTQVLLRISSSDRELLRLTSNVRISVSSFEGNTWQDVSPIALDTSEFAWPLDIPIFPRKGSDESREFQVVVQARDGERVLAETRAVARFAQGRHKRLELELYLCPDHEPGFVCADAACRGEACEVCTKRGSCEPAGTVKDLPDDQSRDEDANTESDATSEGDGSVDSETDLDAINARTDSAVGSSGGAGLDGGASSMDSAAPSDASARDDTGTQDADKESGVVEDSSVVEACKDSSLVRCGQTCVNLSTSASNCGRCGRTCRSNMCSAGACAATSIYTHTPASADAGTFVGSTAIDPPFVYFQDPAGNNVQRVTTSGSAPSVVSYTAPAGLTSLRIDNAYLYALNSPSETNREVLRMPLSGDGFATIMGSTQGLNVANMTTNTNQVFVSSALSRYYIQGIAKAGSTGFTVLASGPSLDYEVEADDSSIFFRDASAILRSAALSEGTPAAVAAFENAEVCRDFTLTADRVLFASSQRVASASKAGGTVTPLAALSAVYVITDAQYAYFVHGLGNDNCSGGTELYRVPVAGGSATRLAVESASCRGSACCGGPLMQDSAALYWVRGNGLAIRRVEK